MDILQSFLTFPMIRSTNVHIIVRRVVWCQVLWRHASSEISFRFVCPRLFLSKMSCVLGIRLGVLLAGSQCFHVITIIIVEQSLHWCLCLLTHMYRILSRVSDIVVYICMRTWLLGWQVMWMGMAGFRYNEWVTYCNVNNTENLLFSWELYFFFSENRGK